MVYETYILVIYTFYNNFFYLPLIRIMGELE